MKTAPSPKEFGWQSCEVVVVIRSEKPFEFQILAEKNVLILVKPFFFEDHLFWGRKNRLNFGETV